MPAIKRSVSTPTENALEGLKFSVLNAPALISLYAAGQDDGDTVSLSVGDRDILVDAEVAVRTDANALSTDSDGILMQEPVPAGKLFLGIDVTTDLAYLLVIEPIA